MLSAARAEMTKGAAICARPAAAVALMIVRRPMVNAFDSVIISLPGVRYCWRLLCELPRRCEISRRTQLITAIQWRRRKRRASLAVINFGLPRSQKRVVLYRVLIIRKAALTFKDFQGISARREQAFARRTDE